MTATLKRCVVFGIFLNLFLTVSTLCQELVTSNIEYNQTETEIVPGLIHVHLSAERSKEQELLNINMLQVDLRKIHIKPVLALDQILGQETTSSMVKRYRALAGINGGFSQSVDPWATYHGDPSGFYVLNGKILSEPKQKRSSFGILNEPEGNQVPFIDQPYLKTIVSTHSDTTILITGINRRRTQQDLILYTPEWGRSTITRPEGTEIVIQDGVVKEIHEQEGSHLIPSNGFVLSASGKYTDWVRVHLAVNTKVEIKHTLTSRRSPGRQLPLENCNYTSAGPALIIDGKKVTDFSIENRGFSGKFSERHPRTAIGISKDKMNLLFVVVDGRNPQTSVGMSLEELAIFMADLGSFNAYNLDGGGSSTMVINEKVVNKFSDERERRSSDALLLFERVLK